MGPSVQGGWGQDMGAVVHGKDEKGTNETGGKRRDDFDKIVVHGRKIWKEILEKWGVKVSTGLIRVRDDYSDSGELLWTYESGMATATVGSSCEHRTEHSDSTSEGINCHIDC